MQRFSAMFLVATLCVVTSPIAAESRNALVREGATHLSPAEPDIAPRSQESHAEVAAPPQDGSLHLGEILPLPPTHGGIFTMLQRSWQPDMEVENPVDRSPKKMYNDFIHWLCMTLSLSLWVIVVATVGYFYTTQPPKVPPADAAPDLETFKEWKHGLFNCHQTPETCMCAFFCAPVRWAHTISLLGFSTFWTAFIVFMGLDFLGGMTTESHVWVVLALVGAAYRQEMRTKYGFEKAGGVTMIQDFLLYFWCMCCVIVQEARQADDAQLVGHPIIIQPNEAEPEAPVSESKA